MLATAFQSQHNQEAMALRGHVTLVANIGPGSYSIFSSVPLPEVFELDLPVTLTWLVV
jgi:hypothetical protein